jgi:hypothetical protein
MTETGIFAGVSSSKLSLPEAIAKRFFRHPERSEGSGYLKG